MVRWLICAHRDDAACSCGLHGSAEEVYCIIGGFPDFEFETKIAPVIERAGEAPVHMPTADIV